MQKTKIDSLGGSGEKLQKNGQTGGRYFMGPSLVDPKEKQLTLRKTEVTGERSYINLFLNNSSKTVRVIHLHFIIFK